MRALHVREVGPVESGLNVFLLALTVSGNNLGIGLTLAQGELSNPQELQRGTTHLEELSLVLGHGQASRRKMGHTTCQGSVKSSPGVCGISSGTPRPSLPHGV